MNIRSYFSVVSRTRVLGTTFVSALLLTIVLNALPFGPDMLDSRPGYTYQDALIAIAGFGEEGRKVYMWASMTLDTLLPAAYASFLAGIIYRLRPKENLWWLAFLPVLAGGLDLCENFQIVAMLIQYPDITAAQVANASLFTVMKSYAVMGCASLAVLLSFVGLVRLIASRRQGQST